MLDHGFGLPLAFILALSASDAVAKQSQNNATGDNWQRETFQRLLPAYNANGTAQQATTGPMDAAAHRHAQGCASCCWRRC
jgi:hypothetical protein